jgi:hypothetical protein
MRLNEENRDVVVIGSSFLVHLILLLCLAFWFVPIVEQKSQITIISSPTEEEVLEKESIEDISEFSELETRIEDLAKSDPIPEENDSPVVVLDDLSVPAQQQDILINEKDALAAVAPEKGSGEGVSSVGGVVDRLTAEIVSSAVQKETLVVWLFDASLSLNAQRTQIAERLEKILSELNSDEELKPIHHVVCGFGSKLNYFIKEPTNDKAKIVHEMKNIPLDESGIENIFSSVETLSKEYKSQNGKRTLIVAFTDEVGDDRDICDRAVVAATKNGVVVHVVGVPSPFGLAKTELKFVDPDEKYDQSERWVEVEQGPETLFKMTLNINSLPIDSEPMDSGFGPYALSRLCASTGGVYFALHPNRHDGKVERRSILPMSSDIRHFFGGETMKKYVPDYRAVKIQAAEIENNPAKLSLVKACSLKNLDLQREFKTIFDAPDQGRFAEELGEGQKAAVSLLVRIEPIIKILSDGEKGFSNLTDSRWKASYLLAMGRTLAIKTRLESYNHVLAEAKSGLKPKNKDTNRWTLVPAGEIKNSSLKKQAERAEMYLKKVVDEFPGTPWALVAKEELRVPLSYGWSESRFEPVVMKGGNNNPLPTAREDDKIKMLKPKPQRKVDKI